MLERASLTPVSLDSAFHLYLQELATVRSHRSYLSALHLLCAVPDVCGALQSTDGTASGASYREWCQAHLATVREMGPADWWKMRCAVLHQGSSLPTDPRSPRSQYDSMSFVTLTDTRVSAHQLRDGGNITLDIAALADEVTAGIRHWFTWLREPENGAVLARVESRLHTVMSLRPKTYPSLPVAEQHVLSSTGSINVLVLDIRGN